MMRELFLSSVVFAGAGTGGVLRHLANRFIPMALPVSFPLSTFIVNVLGCFAMGVLASWFAFRGEASLLGLEVGMQDVPYQNFPNQRMHARAKGRGNRITKRTSHITVVVGE